MLDSTKHTEIDKKIWRNYRLFKYIIFFMSEVHILAQLKRRITGKPIIMCQPFYVKNTMEKYGVSVTLEEELA